VHPGWINYYSHFYPTQLRPTLKRIMPMSFDGLVANTSGWSIGPRARGIGSSGYAARIQYSLPIGHYATAMAEHREPYESRYSRTVLGAPEGESPSGDSSNSEVELADADFRFTP